MKMRAWCGMVVAVSLPSALNAQQDAGEPRKAMPGTKVAVVNVQVFFEKYWRAEALKRKLELDLEPYKEKAKHLCEEIRIHEAVLRKPGNDQQKSKAHLDAIKECRGQLKDSSDEANRLFAKRQDDDIAATWAEFRQGVKAVAEAYGFQIVLGYGEPDKVDFSLQSRDPKRLAIDQGSVTPHFVHGSVDITDAVLQAMRPICNEDMKKRAYPRTEKERK